MSSLWRDESVIRFWSCRESSQGQDELQATANRKSAISGLDSQAKGAYNTQDLQLTGGKGYVIGKAIA